MPEDKEDIVGKYTQLIFECDVGKEIYKNPGMCNMCDETLKPRGG